MMVSNRKKSAWTKCKRRKIVLLIQELWWSESLLNMFGYFSLQKTGSTPELGSVMSSSSSATDHHEAKITQTEALPLHLHLHRNDCLNCCSKGCWPSLGLELSSVPFHEWALAGWRQDGGRPKLSVSPPASVPISPPVTTHHTLSQSFLMLTTAGQCC